MLTSYYITKDMVSLTLSSSYALITSLKQQNDSLAFIEDTDVLNNIKIIHQFIEDILDDKSFKKNKSIMLCIQSIENIIKEINTILDRINTNLYNYNRSWSKYFYSFNCSKDIKLLKNKINILNNRNDLMIKIKSAY